MIQKQCHAKLNVTLQVGAALASGYHPISSVFQLISLHDVMTIQTTRSSNPTLSLRGSGISMPLDGGNILHRCFESFSGKLSQSLNVHIDKRIPLGSGMGGASSNAASFLMALNEIEQWGYSIEELAELSRAFGSDIAFFLNGGTQHVSGTGNVIESIDVQTPSDYLLIHPFLHCSSATVYQAFDSLNAGSDLKQAPHTVPMGTNDLLRATFLAYHEMQQLYESLCMLLDTPVFMTGSGSTFYLTGHSLESLEDFAVLIRDNHPNFLVESVQAIR